MPTTEQIQQVQSNLQNLIALNAQLLEGGNINIDNAFLLLSMVDNTDLGVQVGINLLDGGFWASAAIIEGPLAAAAANFCCGVISNYTTNTPSSLNETTSNLLERFLNTSNQFQYDLQNFYDNTEEYWDVVYSGNVNTAFGVYPVSGSLSDLSNVVVPSPDDTEFTLLLNEAEFGLDQIIWAQLLQDFVITQFNPPSDYPVSEYSLQTMESNASSFYLSHPAYWNYWLYVEQTNKKGEDTSYYEQWQNNIGSGDISLTSANSISDAACNYLFTDLYNGVPNPNSTNINGGLYNREFVFNNMSGIKKQTHTYNN